MIPEIKIKDKKRIIILGCAGSGKSTLSKQLGEALNLNIAHLDKIYYLPNWKERDHEEFKKMQEEIVQEDKWIIDGNFRDTLDIRLNRCDLIIYLDLNRFVSLHNAHKRYKMYKDKQRDSLAEGCLDKFDKSFRKWILNFKKNSKPIIMKKISEYPEKDILIFKTRRSLDKYLKNQLN